MKQYLTMRFPNFKYKAVTLSYDDDVIYDKKLLEIIDEYGLKCTFNLNSGLFAEKSGGRMMTEDEAVALLKNSAHEVAIHGVKHISLAEADSAAQTADVLNDRINLERIFGKIVKGMAYAHGSFDDRTVETLKVCGIDYARTTVSTEKFNIPTDWLRLPATCHHNNARLPELIEQFLKDYEPMEYYTRKTPKLFYLWGHAYEFNDNNNWEIIENFAKKVGNRADVWYATNGEIYNYVKAFDGLIYSASGDIIKNPTATDVFLNYHGKEVKIGAGKTICAL